MIYLLNIHNKMMQVLHKFLICVIIVTATKKELLNVCPSDGVIPILEKYPRWKVDSGETNQNKCQFYFYLLGIQLL